MDGMLIHIANRKGETNHIIIFHPSSLAIWYLPRGHIYHRYMIIAYTGLHLINMDSIFISAFNSRCIGIWFIEYFTLGRVITLVNLLDVDVCKGTVWTTAQPDKCPYQTLCSSKWMMEVCYKFQGGAEKGIFWVVFNLSKMTVCMSTMA